MTVTLTALGYLKNFIRPRLKEVEGGTPICPTQRLQKFRHFKAPKIPTLFWARLLNVRQLKIHRLFENIGLCGGLKLIF